MIYKRGRIWWMKYYRNGKPYRESSGSTKESDAKRLLRKREGEIAEGKLPGVYFDRVCFDELAEDYLVDFRINGKHIRRAELSLRHLQKDFEGFRVSTIDTPRIKSYIERRQNEGASNGTINRELTALKRMLNMGAQQTPPKVDRVPHISMLKEDNVRKGFFEHGDFLALREALPKHLKGFLTFAYKAGWRLGEISTLQWSQIDLEKGIVRLEPGETKNEEGRTIYLDEELKEIFRAQWEARGKADTALPWVFLNRKGTDRVKRFDKAWKSACKKAGIGIKLFHDLRRTAVRNMVRAGIPERVAMMISGHKTRSVFERYNIVSGADLELAAKRQEAYLSTQKGTISGTVSPLRVRK
ncbi:MAG TPA: site-specific integrase [archaeon]|nr:site-specific integrase [archaeon]